MVLSKCRNGADLRPAMILNHVHESANFYSGLFETGGDFISRYLVFDYLSEELAGTLVLGIGEETFGICYLYYFTIIHENNTIAHLAGKAHFMGHANHCHASVGQIDNNIQHFGNGFGVQCRGWFVEQHDVRFQTE